MSTGPIHLYLTAISLGYIIAGLTGALVGSATIGTLGIIATIIKNK